MQFLKDSPSETSDTEALATRPPGNEGGILTRFPGDLPKVEFLVTVTDRPASQRNPNGLNTYQWEPIPMKDLKGIRQAILVYGFHSLYVKELLSFWAKN